MSITAGLVLNAALLSMTSSQGPPPTLWAGHQVTFGSRRVPFKGTVRTRMDSFALARGRWEDGTVRVEARVCSGALHVANDSQTRAVGQFRGRSFGGHARVVVEQRILGAEGACLAAVADDTREEVDGPFAYVPVPAGTTCKDLSPEDWPVDALAWSRRG